MLVFRKILRKNWIKDPYIVSRYFWWHHIQRIIFTTTILDDLWFKASVFLLKAVVILAMRVVIFLLSISVCSSLVSMPIKGEQKPKLTGFYKSSHPEVLCEKHVLKISQNSQESNYHYQSLVFEESYRADPFICIEKRLGTVVLL